MRQKDLIIRNKEANSNKNLPYDQHPSCSPKPALQVISKMSRIAMPELEIQKPALREVWRGNNYEMAQISYEFPGQPLQIVPKIWNIISYCFGWQPLQIVSKS